MALIRPCADLRNNYNEISRICHETKEPMYITKNGSSDLVILSNEAYEKLKYSSEKNTEEKIEKLISEKFSNHYADFEEFKQEIFSKVLQALKDIDEGNYQSMETFCKEMEAKYDIK